MSNIIRKNEKEGAAFFDEDVFYPRLNDKEKQINEAKKKALKIIQEAEAEAGEIMKRFEAQGIQKGIEEVRPLSGLLSGLAEELKRFKQSAVEKLEPIVVDLALGISKKIIKTEIQTNPEIVKQNVLAALNRILDKDSISVSLHPADKEFLELHQADVLKSFRDIKNLTFVSDETISRGGCYIRSDRGDVDATIETQFAEVGKSFGRKETLG